MNKAKFILGAASVALAMAFIFSACSGDDSPPPDNPNNGDGTLRGYCDYGDGDCFPMATDLDEANCAAYGQVVNSCPTYVPPSSSSNRPSSSSVPPPVPSSSSVVRPSSSSVVQTIGYCDYGAVQANGDGGCHPMGTNSDLASCQQWGHVVSSCPTANYGLVEHGGQRYRTVVIGNQTWMAQNLNYEYGNSTCYDNKSENCAKYGQLYDWASMTGQESNSVLYTGVPANFRGVCPTGWHIPTIVDWDALITAVGGSSTAGKKLKAKDGWDFNGTDEYGFRAFPAGGYSFLIGQSTLDEFGGLGLATYWWSINQSSATGAYSYAISGVLSSDDISRLADTNKRQMKSVRCVKN